MESMQTRRQVVAGAAAVAAVAGLTSVAGRALATEAAAASYTPGTYSATYPGFGGDVTVTMTFDTAAITDVSIDAASETSTIGGTAATQLEQAILDAQTTEVDAIGGATHTSDAVLKAAADCVAQATGASTELPEVIMQAGTYKASAHGFSVAREVPVTVTVSDKLIQGIRVDQCAETGHILDAAKLIIPRICDSQCTAVDAISGATITSNAIKAAVDKCVAQALEAAGTDPKAIENFHVNKPAKTHEGETVEYDVDVVVCGMGGTGCAACTRVAEMQQAAGREVSVLALEKAALYGGTSCATTSLFAVNSQVTADRYNGGEPMYDIDEMKDYIVEATNPSEDKLATWDYELAESGPMVDWLYSHGFYFGQPKPGFWGTQYASQYYYCGYMGEDNLATLHRCFEQMIGDYVGMGGQYLLETSADELIIEDGKVTGVKAHNVYDGTEYIIHAKAVMISEGGFAGDPEKMQTWVQGAQAGDWAVLGMTQNTGNMMASALDAGGRLDGMEGCIAGSVHNIASAKILSGFPINYLEGQEDVWRGDTACWSLNDVPNIMSAARDAIYVYPDGTRHINEGGTWSWGTDGPLYWTVWSQPQIDDIAANGFAENNTQLFLCCGFATFPLNEPIPEMADVLAAGEAQGFIVHADTLEELAEKMDMDPSVFSETIATYNDACTSGNDAEFGKDAQYLKAVDGAPYYAIKAMPRTYNSGGGLVTDLNMRVLDASGEPIAGLYAGGNCNMCMPAIAFGGELQMWAYLSGKTAGEKIEKYLETL